MSEDQKKKPSPCRLIEHLKPYDPVSSLEKIREKKHAEPLKLDWNESTVPPSQEVVNKLIEFLTSKPDLNLYPELECRKLLESLASYTSLPANFLLVTNGSDDSLDLICKTFIDHGDRILVPSPTYSHFSVFAGSKGAEIINLYSDKPFFKMTDEILKNLKLKPKLVYIATPNNPTGVVYPPEDIMLIASKSPETIILVDEAYFEFCGITSISLVRDFTNIIVTRTFSKAMGIAGLRAGYLAAQPEILADLKKVFNPKSVNVFAQIAATTVLEDLSHVEKFVSEVTDAKKYLKDELLKRGIETEITPANFILLRFGDPAKIIRELENEGIYVRDRSTMKGLEGFIRVSVGTLNQMKEFIRRLDIVLAREKFFGRSDSSTDSRRSDSKRTPEIHSAGA
jgi:histidinol-phosphate aminotransferase